MQMSKQMSRKIICFSPDKYDAFKTAVDSPEAFHLINAKVQPGRNNQLEIKVFKDTDLVAAHKKLDFSKTYTSINKEEKKDEIFRLCDLNQDSQMVTVDVQYIKVIEREKPIMTKFGPRSITTAIIGDVSGTMRLVIWSPDLLKKLMEGEFYRISSLRVKMFDKGQLNTTSDTKVVPIQPFDDVQTDIEHLCQEQVTEVQFQSVQVVKKISCPVCFKLFDSDEYKKPLLRCTSCNFKVNTTSLPAQVSVTAYVTQQTKLTFSVEAIDSLINDKPELKEDLDAFEDFLILNKFQIHLNSENVVTKIKKC